MTAQSLSGIPGSCTEIRKELEAICGAPIHGVTYKTLWNSLVGHLGQERAEQAVQDVFEIRIAKRILLVSRSSSEARFVSTLLAAKIVEARDRARRQQQHELQTSNVINFPHR